MCHPGWLLLLVTSILIHSSQGAPQTNAKENLQEIVKDLQHSVTDLQLKGDSLKKHLDQTKNIHNIKKREPFFREHPAFNPFHVPWDQQFRAFARMGDLDMVQVIAAHVYNEDNTTKILDSQDSRNWTALMWASRYNHSDVVSWLLEYDAKVGIQNNMGDTALLWAVGGGHEAVVELLMKHHADPNMPEHTGLTPVGVAAAMGREGCLRIMDKYGHIDLAHEDNRGRTPINLAATVGQASMVQLLGFFGNIDVVDKNKMSPVHWAMNLKDTSTLSACLLLCPNLNLTDDRNNTALEVAIQVKNVDGEKIIRDYMAQPTSSCWLDGIEYPANQYTFFDCKQIQCMCMGFWRHTGVFDPLCFGGGEGAGEFGERGGGAVRVQRQVNVLARQEIQRYDLNKTFDEVSTIKPATEEDAHHHDRKRDVANLSQQKVQTNEDLNEKQEFPGNDNLKEIKYDYMPPSPISSSEQKHQKSHKLADK